MPTIQWNKLISLPIGFLPRRSVKSSLFDGTLIAVPSIDQARYYDLMVCFEDVG